MDVGWQPAPEEGLRAMTSTIRPRMSRKRQALGEEKGGGWEKWMEIVLKVKFAQIGFVHAKACHPINTK